MPLCWVDLNDLLGSLQMVRFLDGLLKMTYDLWQPSLSGLGMSQCYGTGTPLNVVTLQMNTCRLLFSCCSTPANSSPRKSGFASSLSLDTRQVRVCMQPGPINSADNKLFGPDARQQNSQNVEAFGLTWSDDFALLQDMLCSGLL